MAVTPATCSAVHSCSQGLLSLSALWNKGKYTTTTPLSKLIARQLRILSIVYAQHRMRHYKQYSIKCLALLLIRYVPFRTVDEEYRSYLILFKSLSLVFSPHTDGVFLLDNPQQMVLNGQVAKIPFVTGLHHYFNFLNRSNLLFLTGDVDDEGTIFASPTLNVT